MLNVVIEELGFGREQRRERPMSSHIPYLRHVADTVIGLESGAILSRMRRAAYWCCVRRTRTSP